MKRTHLWLVVTLLSFGLFTPRGTYALYRTPAIISPGLQTIIENAEPGEHFQAIVRLVLPKDWPSNTPWEHWSDPGLRQQEIVSRFQAAAERARAPLKPLLEQLETEGEMHLIGELWIINGLAVDSTASGFTALANSPYVARIDPVRVFNDPDWETNQTPNFADEATTVEPNISQINATALWEKGFDGQGIVVASLDTGVSLSHPDLQDKWRGGSNSWFDPYLEYPDLPVDTNGHGTAVMGVLVGGSAGGTAIGVAPGAQWIAARIFNNANQATTLAVHQAMQWILDPDGNPSTADAPQVVNNSWTFAAIGCDLEFQADLQAWRAAGIIPVFAAGNFGPDSGTSASPANNPEALAVGAVDDLDNIYYLSSRGPSHCGEATSIYPELVAPGVNIRTAWPGGGYALVSGTSIAAPHLAGTLALLLDAYGGLLLSDQESALLNSALDLGTPGADNDYGFGRLDAWAAYQWLQDYPPARTPTATATLTTTPTATSSVTPIWLHQILPLMYQDFSPSSTATPSLTPQP